MTETTTRHERRKQRTRALIRETAWELFAAHGYDATTIKAIADAADVAPRLAAATAVTGLRELYDSREARSLGPEPTGADLIQLVNQVIDYAIAGLAAVTAAPAH